VTTNATTAPDGTTTAEKLIASVDNNTHFILQSNMVVTAQIYNASIFAKKAEYDTLRLRMVNLWSPTPTAVFNLTSKTVVSTTSATARITELTDGWFRLDLTATGNATAGSNAQLEVLVGDNDVTSFAGDGTSGIFIWQAQLETGSVATSYIVTTAGTASRAADAISLASASSLIGATEGTIYLNAEILKLTTNNFYIGISDGVNLTDAIYLQTLTNGNLQVLVRKTGNADGTLAVLSANWTSGLNKVAIVYTATTVRIYINGVDKGNTTFVALPTLNRVTLGSRIDVIGTLVGTGGYKALALFPTALDATQAIALTTP
jgi:hypothetical protein